MSEWRKTDCLEEFSACRRRCSVLVFFAVVLVLGDIRHRLLQALDLDAVLFGVVPKRRMDGLLRQKRAVDLHLGQAVEGLHDGLVGYLQGVMDDLALDEHRRHGAGGDGRAAAEGLEFGVLDDLVFVDV